MGKIVIQMNDRHGEVKNFSLEDIANGSCYRQGEELTFTLGTLHCDMNTAKVFDPLAKAREAKKAKAEAEAEKNNKE